MVLSGLMHPQDVVALQRESANSWRSATRCDVQSDDGHAGRGGKPRRALHTAAGGEIHTAIYRQSWLAEFLGSTAGGVVQPTGPAGSYSYYTHPGDHLGLHLDIDECDLSLITCVTDSLRSRTRGRDGGGEIRIYHGYAGRSLRDVRRDVGWGSVDARLEPGQSLILLGGVLPHEVLPVRAGQARVVSLMCFKLEAGPNARTADA